MNNIKLSNGFLTAFINPKGAELNSLKDSANEYIWEGDPKYWGKHSPVLFPIVGTLKNNTYHYNDQEYTLTRHGFARDMEFQVTEQTNESATFVLVATPETLKAYPFDFELQMVYTLNENTLGIQYNIINKGTSNMPFCVGAHPAFALPGDFKNYSLAFEKNEKLVSRELENDLVSNKEVTIPAQGGILPLDYTTFENDALIFTSLDSRAVTIQKEGKDFLRVSFAAFPHLGIWTKPGAPFICIEPWQGYADSIGSNGQLLDKKGIVVLPENETFTTGFTIEIIK